MPDQWAREQGHYFVELREKYLRKTRKVFEERSFDSGKYGGPKVSRQFQFAHGNFNLLTAISICSRQFQFAHGSFNLLTAVSISLTAISICSRQFQFAHGSFNFAHGSFNFAHDEVTVDFS